MDDSLDEKFIDVPLVSKIIESEKDYLNSLSQELWKNPELAFEEVHAHALLTEALEKYGFIVQRHYMLPTAFRAEFSSQTNTGPVIAVLCEYDALPEIGHACGHNLIAESGIAAGMAIKAVMETNPSIQGKIVVLGTPAEEDKGGKICLIEYGAFEDIDAAIMAHPEKVNFSNPSEIAALEIEVTYKIKENEKTGCTKDEKNPLDAAVACYNNITLLRQQIKPSCRMHGIITKGGITPGVIPEESQVLVEIRAPTMGELSSLTQKVTACLESAASSTGCEVVMNVKNSECYQNLLSNHILTSLYKDYCELFGMKFQDDDAFVEKPSTSTDMGNVSHVVPGIQPLYSIGHYGNHTEGFAQRAASPEAQDIALIASKAMALTALQLMRSPSLVKEMKDRFQKDIHEDLNLN